MINVLEYLENTMKTINDPNKAAFTGSNDEALSFSSLYEICRSCGSYFAKQNTAKQPIAVFMQKSPAMIAAFFGVVSGGNYYIPLDSEMPAFRIRMILDVVKPSFIICDEATSAIVSGWKSDNVAGSDAYCDSIILYEKIIDHPVDEDALQKIRRNAIDTDPIYVVFTSGSTGIPKGVVATHRSVIDYIENLSKVLKVTENTIFGNQSPLYLDACLKEVYTTLKFGSSAYLIPQSLFMFPVKLIEYINEKKINTICWVASALSLVAGLGALKASKPETLHTIAFGSEVFPVKHYNLWRETLPETRFIHLYGPTEATGMSCFYETTRTYGPDESIPIGHPFPNTEIILIDENGQVPETGQPGEICIRGTCLSPGYFADPEKTSNTFIQNPLSKYPDLIYKTGDLGRRGENDELYYISRKDHQIKHMGHRIELAEIEWVANGCDGIGLACAVFDNEKSRIFLFYVTASDSDKISKSEVRAYLKKNLPRYMLPHNVYELDELPQTPGGKLDRVKLLKEYCI